MSGKYFLSEMKKPDVSRRMVFDMKPVLFQPEAAKINSIFYTVYRNLGCVEKKIRYDLTIIPPNKIGDEFPKTFGHYHGGPQPEIYEVLEGQAYFLLQKHTTDPADIKEVYIVEAAAGEKAVMPPSFGHLTINVGDKDLVLANWISLVEYDYETIKKYRGGCYYVLDRGQTIEFEKNQNYKSVPNLKKLRPKDVPELGIKQGAENPIWDLRSEPEKLEWLLNPEKYSNLLTIENLYKEI